MLPAAVVGAEAADTAETQRNMVRLQEGLLSVFPQAIQTTPGCVVSTGQGWDPVGVCVGGAMSQKGPVPHNRFLTVLRD
jgi:hypothetical protein